ncbi:hypothetical protein ANRL1_00045 [Anaerolineae bacterium]|nr:hypothetical protein ANRL1_00045 [Anaerolineae bacterium]
MHIPVHIETAEVVGHARKQVRCEKCGKDFEYGVIRRAAGDHVSVPPFVSSRAHERAEHVAQQKLERSLNVAEDLVACPHCGWFQARMVRAKRLWLFKIAALIAALTPWPLLMLSIKMVPRNRPADEFKMYLGTAVGSAVALVAVVAVLLAFMFRPNAGAFFPFSKKDVNRGKPAKVS